MLSFSYVTVFGLYYCYKIRNPLKPWQKETKEMHVLSVILALVGLGIVIVMDGIGVSIEGVCGISLHFGGPYTPAFLMLGITLSSLTFNSYFLVLLNKLSKGYWSLRKYLRFYTIFVVAQVLNLVLICIGRFGMAAQCSGSERAFRVFQGFAGFSLMVLPITLMFTLSQHPQISLSKLLLYFRNLINSLRNKLRPKQIQFQDLNGQLKTNRTSVLIELNLLSNPSHMISQLITSNKINILATTLTCIAIQSWDAAEKERKRSNIINSQLRLWHGYQFTTLTVNTSVVEAYRKFFLSKIIPLEIQFVSYAPKLFRRLQLSYGMAHLHELVHPERNLQQIIGGSETDGGSSGQLFLVDKTNTIILKGLTTKELTVFQQRIQSYYQYLASYEGSYLVRVLGIYSASSEGVDYQVAMMIMKNIFSEIPKDKMIRIYDLKGSVHGRQVVAHPNRIEVDGYPQKTLKDVDFQNFEKQVHISSAHSELVKNQLELDALYLQSQGLIDYSLILLKYTSDTPELAARGYPSTKQPQVSYIFGIIDFLETWNLRKKSEKLTKSILTNADDISSQNPEQYCHRFIHSLIRKIFQ